MRLSGSLKDLTTNICDYAQERLVNLLENKFKDNSMEKLCLNDFISLTNLIDQFVIDFDQIANKKTSSLRSWIQNQVNIMFGTKLFSLFITIIKMKTW